MSMEKSFNQRITEEALRYESLGFSVMPLGEITKDTSGKKNIQYVGLWKKFQTHRASREEIKSWNARNLGIVTGPISNLLVVDLDTYKEGYDNELARSLDLPITPTAQTASGGLQLFFKWPEGVSIKNDVSIGHAGSGIDIRAEGGMVIASPSKTSYGEYFWQIDPFETPLAEIPPKLLGLIAQQGGSEYKPKKRLSELLGLKEGEGRNTALASIVGKMLLTTLPEAWDEEVWPIAVAVNKTYIPPMELSEVESIYKSITKIETERRSQLATPQGRIELNPVLWRDIDAEVFPANLWRVRGLIPWAGFVILASISGEGKTWVAFELAKAISTGADFLDTFKTEKGKVLYIDAENPKYEVQRRGRQLGFVDGEDLLFLHLDSLNLNDAETVSGLLSLIETQKITTVFIDTFRAVGGGVKEEKAEEIRMLFNRFKSLKEKGVAVIWLDHFRKPDRFDSKTPQKEHLFGSQDKAASVEVILMLKNNGNDLITMYQRKNRLGKELTAFRMKMEDEGSVRDRRTILSYQGEVDELETAKEEAKLLIPDALKEGGRTTADIIDILKALKIGERNVRAALKELREEGVLDSVKQGRSDFYFLRPLAEDSPESEISGQGISTSP